MAEDRPEDGGARRDEGPSEPSRRPRTPPTIELEASRLDAAEEPAAAQADGPGSSAPPSRRVTATLALAAGAVAGLVVTSAVWFAGGRGGNAPLDPSTIATLETLGARLTRLEEAPTPTPRPDAATTARIDTLDKAVAALRGELEAARSKAESLGKAVDALKAAPREGTPPTTAEPPVADDQRLIQLEGAVKAVTEEVGRLRDVKAEPPPAPASELKASDVKASEASLRRAVHALALDLAVRQGVPYAAELAALRKAGLDDAALKPLDRFAQAGVPDGAALCRDLIAALPKSPAPGPEPVGTAVRGGWFERLEAGAARLIKLRRVETGEGESGPADDARVIAAARRGDAAAVAREIAALPDASRAKYQPWLDQFTAREAALTAAHRTVSETVAALAATSMP